MRQLGYLKGANVILLRLIICTLDDAVILVRVMVILIRFDIYGVDN